MLDYFKDVIQYMHVNLEKSPVFNENLAIRSLLLLNKGVR